MRHAHVTPEDFVEAAVSLVLIGSAVREWERRTERSIDTLRKKGPGMESDLRLLVECFTSRVEAIA